MRRRVLPMLLALCFLLATQPVSAQTLQQYEQEFQQQLQQYDNIQGIQRQQFQPQSNQMQGQVSMQQNTGFVPNNFLQQQSLPMLNSQMSPQVLSPYNPGSAGRGVDILDESMQYHNNGFAPVGITGMNGMGMNNMSMNNGMSMRMNNMGMNMGMNNGMMNGMGSCQHNTCQHNTCQHNTTCGGNSCNHSHGNGSTASGGDGKFTSQAIGAIGAAALMGSFISNGGIGGVMRSVGMDNSRHIRGASIGGY